MSGAGQRVRAGLAWLVLAVAGGAAALAGGDDADWRQTVRLDGFGTVELVLREVPGASPPAAVLRLEDATGAAVYRFPPLPGTGEAAFFRTREAGLADVDRDGRDDVVVIVEAMTGIGPGGAEPFPLAGVYLARGHGFERATALEAHVNGEPAYGRWDDLGSLLDALARAADLPD